LSGAVAAVGERAGRHLRAAATEYGRPRVPHFAWNNLLGSGV